ncbi:unnamed protein product [Adineta steineri]|uniref:Jacalin-type lectin domain-containing protein n=1 Tax=Adineta steineri TaxID=433720 RepID=A0A819UAL9_9BILA|nr:unnamed protein product [Adineta steineri]CAF4091888.1 unnamed protein product [Adineta steineri]
MHLSWFVVLVVALAAVAVAQSSNRKRSSYYQASRIHGDSNEFNRRLMNFLIRKPSQESSEDEDDIEEAQLHDETAPSGIVAGPIYAGSAQGGKSSNDINDIGSKDIFIPQEIHMTTANYRKRGVHLSSIQITYKGLKGKVVNGSTRGKEKPDICDSTLMPGEQIVKVTVATDDYIVGLQFTTSTGRKTPWCGGDSGNKFTAEYPGHVLSYIATTSGTIIDSLQFFWVAESVLNPATIGAAGCDNLCSFSQTYTSTATTCGLTCAGGHFGRVGSSSTCNSNSTFCRGGTATLARNTYVDHNADCANSGKFGCGDFGGCCVNVGNDINKSYFCVKCQY